MTGNNNEWFSLEIAIAGPWLLFIDVGTVSQVVVGQHKTADQRFLCLLVINRPPIYYQLRRSIFLTLEISDRLIKSISFNGTFVAFVKNTMNKSPHTV